jgi:nicotinamide-nucleotide adenylyltransferase
LIYTSNSRWPLPPAVPPPSRIRISVLDSSFNPPHAAHKALAETTSSSSDAQLLAFTISNADKQLDKEDLYNRLEMIRAMAVDLNRGQEEEVKEKEKEKGKWNNVAVAVLDAATFVKKSQVLKQEVSKLLREEYGESNVEPEFIFPVGEFSSRESPSF